jgi:hypothetical protein
MIISLRILVLPILLIATDCDRAEKDIKNTNISTDNNLMYTLKETCLRQVNTELTEILSNKEILKAHLGLDSSEVRLIIAKNIEAKQFHKKADRVIRKLIGQLTDTTELKIHCQYYDKIKVCKGDLALLSIYQIEKFPFALALGVQWCTGDAFSDSINLPYNMIEYCDFDRGYPWHC